MESMDRPFAGARMAEANESCGIDCPLAGAATVAIPAADGLDRRTFLSRALLAAATVALAACGVDSVTAPFSGTADVNIGSYPALETVGGVALATLNGAPVALVRESDTSVLALSRVCPHQGGSITTSGSGFRCTRHGAQFSLTGMWLGGQRTTNMRSYPTTFDASTGELTVG